MTGRSIILSIHLAGRTHLEKNQHWLPSYPLFKQSSTNHISKVLMRHNIKTVGLPPRKIITSFLQHIKDNLGFKTAGI